MIYRLDADSESDAEKFTVNTVDGKGVLRLVGDLDYERKSLYQLRVRRTQGIPALFTFGSPSVVFYFLFLYLREDFFRFGSGLHINFLFLTVCIFNIPPLLSHCARIYPRPRPSSSHSPSCYPPLSITPNILPFFTLLGKNTRTLFLFPGNSSFVVFFCRVFFSI